SANHPHILEQLRLGEVPGQYPAAPRVDLDHPDSRHPGPAKALVEPPDAGEEATDSHGYPSTRPTVAASGSGRRSSGLAANAAALNSACAALSRSSDVSSCAAYRSDVRCTVIISGPRSVSITRVSSAIDAHPRPPGHLMARHAPGLVD